MDTENASARPLGIFYTWYLLSVVFSKKKIPTHGRDIDGEKELTAVAEDPQQHQEQVDEVQIQG